MHLKVLFVLHLPPPVHGASMVGQYIKDSKVINTTFDASFINLATASDLKDIQKLSLSKVLNIFKLMKRIGRTIKETNPDLVYITPNSAGGPFYKDFFIVSYIKMLCPNIVVHYHNKGVSRKSSSFFDDKLYRSFFKGLKVIQLSELLYYDIEKYVKIEDISFCGNGIPVESYDVTTVKNEIPQLLFLSNLIGSKGLFVLLDACKLLHDKGVQFKCSLVGGETEEVGLTRLEKEIDERNLNDCVTYLGKKYNKEKAEVFQQSDLFVFPTMYPNECFPVVCLEAMSHGLPVISTNEGAIPDIVQDGSTGYVVERNSPEKLAEKMEVLIENADMRQSMGKEGKDRFDNLYTLEVFEENMCDILKKCLK